MKEDSIWNYVYIPNYVIKFYERREGNAKSKINIGMMGYFLLDIGCWNQDFTHDKHVLCH
jgi:hypothetical protein